MYEELVKRLRSHDGWALNKTLDEAADAIEEQDMCYRHLERDYKDLCAYLPRWIPVNETLPDNIDEEVLVCNEGYGKDGTGFATVAVYNGNGWLECWERKQYLDCITYWMPLPEPPKEET